MTRGSMTGNVVFASLKGYGEEIMTIRSFAQYVVVASVVAATGVMTQTTQTGTPSGELARPGFHHIHMNSPDPSATINAFLKVYPASTKVTEGGFEGIRSANGVTLLFTRVSAPPPAPGPGRVTAKAPQTAFWHHVWAASDGRATLKHLREIDPGFDQTKFIPQFTSPAGGTVDFSSDTFGGFLTTGQVEEAKRKGVAPTHQGGYFNWYGPDGVVMETTDGRAEAYNIVGMFQDQPYCALFWYRKHLNAADQPASGRGGQGGRGQAGAGPPAVPAAPTSEADCKVTRGTEVSWPSTYKRGHYRVPPPQLVYFDDLTFRWYMNQEDRPLAPTRGQLMDHISLSVANLDAWVAKLKAEGVKLLEQPYKFDATRAVLIEGPSREAIELVEKK
jgi:hypothetical protein